MLKSANKTETNVYTLEVSVSGEDFNKAILQAYNKQKNKIQLPGFRKGKAPLKMIEKFYGEGVFYEDALDIVYPGVVGDAIKEAGIEPVAAPHDLDVTKIGKDGVEMTMKVTVKPEISIDNYKGIEADKGDASVCADDVKKELASMQERNARVVTVDDRKAKKNDIAVIDFEGFVDGVAFDGGKGENFDLEIGSGSFVPGFEDQLVGMKAGEEKDIDITFPENYTPELAGKPVIFHVKINEVKVKEVPAIDDEFAKDVSEFDTLKDLKADIKKKMTAERTEAAQRAFEDVLMAKVAESVEAEIPTEMVELQAAQMTEGFKQQLASQGIPFDQYLKMTNTTEADFTKQAYGPAEQQVKMDLAVKAIIDAEKLDATDDEVEAEMKNVADKYGMDLDTVKKYLRPEEVKEQVIREKVIKVVADSAKAVAPAEEKAELEAEGEIVEKPAKKPAAKKTTKKAEGEEKAEKAPAKKPAAKKTAKKDAE